MRRFEFKDGASNKFWEILLSGASYTTKYGRIGAEGQSSTKTFASDAKALAAHDKIVAEKVKSGYVEVTTASAKKVTRAATKKPAAPAPVAPAIHVHDRASFEEAFGPIKKLGSANSRLRECRLPGPSYYSPDQNATPPMFTSVLWTTGFHPEGSDGTDVSDWQALGEAVAIARSLASTLKGVSISSDTDCDYYPFVFPGPLAGSSVAKHVYAALGCKTKRASDLEVRKTKKPESFFWEPDDEPEDYFSSKEIARCREAAVTFRTLEGLVAISMSEDFVTYPVFFGGVTKSGLLTGVFGIRVDT